MIIDCKTASQIKKAVKSGNTARVLAGAMVSMTLVNQADAVIVVCCGAYLNMTLDNSQATIKTWDNSQATIKTLDNSQATIKTLDNSQATIKTLDNSQATIETLDNSQATIETWGSSQATIKTWDNSQATIKTWGSSQATIKTWGSSQATIKTLDNSQATVETWGSKSRLPDNITHVGGVEVANHPAALIADVAASALSSDDALVMDSWHCGTSHCIAGWATHLAGERGKELEAQMGPASAGLVLLGRDAAAHFYDDANTARDWLRQFLPAEAQ